MKLVLVYSLKEWCLSLFAIELLLYVYINDWFSVKVFILHQFSIILFDFTYSSYMLTTYLKMMEQNITCPVALCH